VIKHEIMCDVCERTESAHYNGEHWVAPESGWFTLMQNNDELDVHICDNCAPTRSKKKKTKEPHGEK
jgi:hypothetical protein